MAIREAGEHKLRFGVFEFDPKTRALYRNGYDTGLEQQPAHVLELLLNCPGRIVSREEIKAGLWQNERCGNLDDRINHAIRRIREVLHDRQDDPQFIETVPKRGYRFIGAVQPASEPGAPYAVATHSDAGPLARWPAVSFVAKFLGDALSGNKALTAICICAFASIFGVTLLLGTRVHSPVISYVTPIRARPDQTIVLTGRHLGEHVPYRNTDSPYLAVWDLTAHWAAGRIIENNFDDVMLTVARWKNSEIVITGFTGLYGHGNWKLNPGDWIVVAVWNPQSGAGPAKFYVRVAGLQASR